MLGEASSGAAMDRTIGAAVPDAAGEHADPGLSVLGRSRAFTQVLEIARRVAPTDASVFITGENGTGKELIARYIHRYSRRAAHAFAVVSCGSLPDGALEGELFGHVGGAFPGALRGKPGLLETVNGGTLFLDEITQLPDPLQIRLLERLEGEVSLQAGAAASSTPIDLRFIAASTRDAHAAVQEGALRGKLYYLLSVVPLHVPALRDRPEDIPLLAQYFLVRSWSRLRSPHEPLPHFGPAALRALQDRSWPGNVRELQNAIESAVVLVPAGAELGPDHLGPNGQVSRGHAAPPPLALAADGEDQSYHTTRERLLADFETRYLSWLLSRTAGNMSRAARIAGVDRTTLYRLMEKHGLHRQTIVLDGQA